MDSRAARLDCARHRPLADPDARARAGRGQRLHGPRRGADGRTGVQAAAAAPVERDRPQVPLHPRIQEPDDARHAGDLHGSDRAPRPGGTVRREGGRAGTAAADHSGGGIRRRRLCRGATRRAPDQAEEDRQGAAGESRRTGGAVRARGVPADPMAGTAARRAAMGRRRRPRQQRAVAEETEGRSRDRSHRRGARMMRLPRFRFVAPRTVEEAAAALAEAPLDTMLLAGGTDLLPNMKRRQQVPRTLVSLRHVDALRALSPSERARRGGGNGAGLTIGAGVTLTELVRSREVRHTCAGLWQAAAQVATPHLRNMGTIGGNLCLDTRCTYYDQTYEWRQAIGFCMKKAGDICWVATSSPRCLAVSSTDTAPVLQALGATVRLVSAAGERNVPVADLFANDGIHYLTRRPDEILTQIHVPDQTGWRSTYWKLRRRGSLDFPAAPATAAGRLHGAPRLQGRPGARAAA